jgi:hypothetical protein
MSRPRPRPSPRKGHGPALPEAPAARWRRVWVVWLEAALHRIAVAGRWLHGIWVVSIIGPPSSAGPGRYAAGRAQILWLRQDDCPGCHGERVPESAC